MKQRTFLFAAAALLWSGVASAQGLDGLFLQMTMRSGRIEESHYYFLPDGRYLNGVPEGGLTAADLERTCAKIAKAYSGESYCGTYTLSGGQLVLTPRQGPLESLTFARDTDGNLELDGHFAKRVVSFPVGQRLDGRYSRNLTAGAVAYGETYIFRPDGTFSTTSLGGVSTEQGLGTKETAANGTYRLSGNVLELTSNGKTTRLVAYTYSVSDDDIRLNLNGQFFRKNRRCRMISTAAALDRQHGITGVAHVVEGHGGLPKVRITTPAADGEIYLHGAQVTSWVPAGHAEVLFVSAASRWETGRAIRGGIPICFPWFGNKSGDPQAPAHGFVRNKPWTLESIAQTDSGVAVSMATVSDEQTRARWPFDFRLVLRATFGETLRVELTATNAGTTALTLEEALHTYFAIGDVSAVRVVGPRRRALSR